MNGSSKAILIVEDNPDNQQLVIWILEDEGYEITCVDSAEEGLEMLEIKNYDLVLMDISLPGMDGKEATQKIRAMPHLQKLPVLALTAHAVQGEREAILASGVNGLLTKPVDEEELVTRIRSLLGS